MKRSKFSLSHYKLQSARMGKITPIACLEVLPGDTIQMASSALVRLSPLVTPVMHPVHIKIHHWFVPNRLVWDEWEDFITGGPTNDPLDAPQFPQVVAPATTGFAQGTLMDYLGVPPGCPNISVSALPLRAYQLIYNEFYRDQDILGEVVVDTGSGQDTTTDQFLQNEAWQKDYFTTSRPWAQKGPEVTIPLGKTGLLPLAPFGNMAFSESATGTARQLAVGTAGALSATGHPTQGNTFYKAGLVVDASYAGTVNQLREAFALQRYAEARARYGSRYTEYLRYLGVNSSDARLQRPEYLGGGKSTVQFSEVLQTGPNAAPDNVVGGLFGHGIGGSRSNRFRRFFEEHGHIISLMMVKPIPVYGQGLHKMWKRTAKEHFFQKELQDIGQMEVFDYELYAQNAQTETVFGYQDRYDDYRRMYSSVAGEFRTTLNTWHFGREFTAPPVLNQSFISAVPTERPFADTTTDPLLCMINHSIQARRIVKKTAGHHVR